MIVFVGAVVIGATGAFFSDTETSTGNTFTAGAIDLKIDNESYYSANVDGQGNLVLNTGTSWLEPLDLDGQFFFNFRDLKPGDWGEDTISLHVNNNDAYACVDVRLDSDDDNNLTEPEEENGDDTGGVGEGELADAVNFIWWADDGDNVLEEGEDLLQAGPLGNLEVGQVTTVALADSEDSIFDSEDLNDGALTGSNTYYIGKAWCFGEFTRGSVLNNADTGPIVRGPGFSCDGSDEDNTTQTDGLTATISFMAVQSRNNGGFVCAPHLGGEDEGEENVVVNPNSLNGWIIDNFDASTGLSTGVAPTVSGTDGDFVTGPGTPPVGTGSFSQNIGTNGNDAQRLMTNAFNGMTLSSFTQIEYSTYVDTAVSDQATYIQLRIDKDGNGTTDDRLFFEPVYQNGTYGALSYSSAVPNQCGGDPSCVVNDTWQTWDADIGGWWSVNDSAGGPPNTKLADYITQYPGAKLSTTEPAFRMQAGGGAGAWDNFLGNFDKLIVNGTTYNFEI